MHAYEGHMDAYREQAARTASTVLEIPVYGMDCQACAGSVELAIGTFPGVESVKADVESCRASVVGDGKLDRDLLLTRIGELGFSVEPPGQEPDLLRYNWKRLLAFAIVGGAIVAGGIYAFEWSKGYFFSGGRIEDLNTFFASITLGAIGLAFIFGLIIAFSPFTFALAPAVMGYVASSRHTSRLASARLSAGFVGGIVTADVMLGALFASVGIAAISFFSNNLPVWYAIITAILVGVALILLRVWTVELPMFKPKLHEARSARGAYLMGLPFGLIACPGCTPLLLPVALGAAATGNALYGAALMGAFALGRGIPLVLLGTSTGAFGRMKGFTGYVPWIEKGVGLLLLAGAAFFAKEFFRVASIFWF